MPQRTIVYYFSATGNSLQVARDVAARLPGAELRSISDAMKSDQMPAADVIGLVFPVYMFGLPLIVARFCRRLRTDAKPYIFGVATCSMADGTLLQLRRVLKARGLTLSAGFVVRMPANYTPLYGAIADARQKKLFEAEKNRAAEIAELVRRRTPGPIEAGNPAVDFFFSRFLYKYCSPRIPGMDKGFSVTDRCNGCEVCVQVCPVENLRMENGRPVWLHHCEQCLACLHWCPEEAIELGSKTKGRRRYRHPDVALKDFLHR
jgi:ferredoxin